MTRLLTNTFIFLFVVFWTTNVYSFVIDEIDVDCGLERYCLDFAKSVEKLKSSPQTLDSLKRQLRFELLTDKVETFYYELVSVNERNFLKVYIEPRKKISKIRYSGDSAEWVSQTRKFLPFKEGDLLSQSDLSDAVNYITGYVIEQGGKGVFVNAIYTNEEEGIGITFNVKINHFVLLQEIKYSYDDVEDISFIKRSLGKFIKKKWNELNFKIVIDRLQKELVSRGYYFSKITLGNSEFTEDGRNIIANINVELGARTYFHFTGNTLFNQKELQTIAVNVVKKSGANFSVQEVRDQVAKAYRDIGYYGGSVMYSKREWLKDKKTVTYVFKIIEGRKVPLKAIRYIGNEKISTAVIRDIYNDKSSVLASRNYLDENFLKRFRISLIKYYLRHGFVFIDIKEPKVLLADNLDSATVEFKIKEGTQAFLGKVLINTGEKQISEKLIESMTNKEGKPLDVISLESDVERVLSIARESGYYFAKFEGRIDDIVSYHDNYREAQIAINLNIGNKVLYNKALIAGIQKTRPKVINREIFLEDGDIITPSKVNDLRERLSSIGLFSRVSISPVIVSSGQGEDTANLLIQVEERKFGVIEVAPGFRTDIGLKLSTGISYNNLQGLNQSVGFRAQANERLDFDNLDERRRTEERRVTEYDLRVNFTEPYLFGFPLEFDTSVSAIRKRFFGFDATITRGSVQFSKSLGRKWVTSLKYQLEDITQFDATEEKDSGSFTIGGITPSIFFDNRDSPVNPRSGSFHGLTLEIANDNFGSQQKEDLEINFYKLISRNRFYFKWKKFVLASSVSFGVQQNLADEPLFDESGDRVVENGVERTKGYIPSIKVFRLDGVDTVRGFADEEINLLDSGEDISEALVQDKAFFTNIKIEPRFYMNDQFAIGLFFDAGRVTINKFKPLDMRTAVGTSLKVLTPVGTLDFDYGVKTQRRYFNTSSRESFGRFHLSIGFF